MWYQKLWSEISREDIHNFWSEKKQSFFNFQRGKEFRPSEILKESCEITNIGRVKLSPEIPGGDGVFSVSQWMTTIMTKEKDIRYPTVRKKILDVYANMKTTNELEFHLIHTPKFTLLDNSNTQMACFQVLNNFWTIKSMNIQLGHYLAELEMSGKLDCNRAIIDEAKCRIKPLSFTYKQGKRSMIINLTDSDFIAHISLKDGELEEAEICKMLKYGSIAALFSYKPMEVWERLPEGLGDAYSTPIAKIPQGLPLNVIKQIKRRGQLDFGMKYQTKINCWTFGRENNNWKASYVHYTPWGPATIQMDGKVMAGFELSNNKNEDEHQSPKSSLKVRIDGEHLAVQYSFMKKGYPELTLTAQYYTPTGTIRNGHVPAKGRESLGTIKFGYGIRFIPKS